MADVVYSNVRELMKQLKDIEPELKKAMVKGIKTEIAPLATQVRTALPSVSPLSGANTSGRLGFGNGRPATSVTVSVRTSGSKYAAVTSLASVKVNSPFTAMADYAGRKGVTTRSQVTRPYAYKGGTRTHRNNGQGQAMVNRLNSIRSRFSLCLASRRASTSNGSG